MKFSTQTYPITSSISDNDISNLNSILLGYSSSDLSQLIFTTTSSIQTLGALSSWTSDQVCF